MIGKNVDLRHVETGLSEAERLAAITESKRLRAIRQLGNRWLLAKDYTGHYVPILTKKRAA